MPYLTEALGFLLIVAALRRMHSLRQQMDSYLSANVSGHSGAAYHLVQVYDDKIEYSQPKHSLAKHVGSFSACLNIDATHYLLRTHRNYRQRCHSQRWRCTTSQNTPMSLYNSVAGLCIATNWSCAPSLTTSKSSAALEATLP